MTRIVIDKQRMLLNGIDVLVDSSHKASKSRGWWTDPITGLSLIPGETTPEAEDFRSREIIRAWFPYVVATKIALIHSEVSEGLEAYRVNALDDKLPEFQGITAEMADVLIRVGDLMGCLQEHARNSYWDVADEDESVRIEELAALMKSLSLPEAVICKASFNEGRPDHALEARRKPGGKKF